MHFNSIDWIASRFWIAFFFALMACSPSADESAKLLDKKNMFQNSISSYTGRPVKYLILESNYKLKHFGFEEAEAPFYLDGISLTFQNDVKLFVDIADFR